MKLTKSELEIMNVLWKAERPLSRADILNLSEDKTWKENSIHILLNGMLKKGAIREDGFARSGKVCGAALCSDRGHRRVLSREPLSTGRGRGLSGSSVGYGG